jgi:hypothetical protein
MQIRPINQLEKKKCHTGWGSEKCQKKCHVLFEWEPKAGLEQLFYFTPFQSQLSPN